MTLSFLIRLFHDILLWKLILSKRIMKKLFSILLSILVASADFGFSADGVSSGPTKKEIIIIKTASPGHKPHRDLSPDANAFMYESGSIEVELFEAGSTTVYVLDSHNRVVASDTTEGYEYESVTLQIPSARGNYTLVIWGTYIYGEGIFTVE